MGGTQVQTPLATPYAPLFGSTIGTGAGQRRAVRVWLSGKLWLGLRSADVLCCAVLRVNSHLLGGVVMNIECGRVETGRDAARAQPV